MNKREKQLWVDMAELTLAKCKETCHNLGSCCSGEYCDMAVEIIEKSGFKVPSMPFVKDGKCVIPPYFRPLCSLHQCKINGLGLDPKDPKWTAKYFDLREELNMIGFDEATGL